MQPNITSNHAGRADLQTVARASIDSPTAAIAWTLHKGHDSAQCVLCPLGDRIELHIRMKEEVIVSQHCRGPEQAAFVSNAWFGALITRGWR
jgi:hypothetical protein